jgi:hypothetical protein
MNSVAEPHHVEQAIGIGSGFDSFHIVFILSFYLFTAIAWFYNIYIQQLHYYTITDDHPFLSFIWTIEIYTT